jgi:hypothetical protein
MSARVDGVLHAALNVAAFVAWLIIACATVAGPTFAVRDQFGAVPAVVTVQVLAALVVATAITWCARHLRAAAAAGPACTCLDSPRLCRLHPAPDLTAGGNGRHHRAEVP